jgi:membrane protease YdiL (CAAX protease family)
MKENSHSERNFSIFGSFFWMLFLASGIQAIFAFIVTVWIGNLNMPSNEVELIFMRPDVIAIFGILAAILTFLLIKKAAHQSGMPFPFEFLAFQSVNKTTLAKVFLVGVGYYIFASLTIYMLSLDTPKFMLDVKSQTHTAFDILMLVLGICIVAPITEEVIFRGLAYTRLVQSRVGVAGAIVITSLVFTAIHSQYDFIDLAILSLFAFLLAYVRYKTRNLVYCIALHMQLNIMSTIELFFFL